MLIFRVLATIFVALSCVTSFIKNEYMFDDIGSTAILFTTLYSWLWRAFIIVAIWII